MEAQNDDEEPGVVIPFCQSLTRRCQFPLSNYVALAIHKLMGNTFNQLETSIKQGDKMYSIWLTSQLYVILSRVHYLRNVTFVGLESETLAKIKNLLETVNLPECISFFKELRTGMLWVEMLWKISRPFLGRPSLTYPQQLMVSATFLWV